MAISKFDYLLQMIRSECGKKRSFYKKQLGVILDYRTQYEEGFEKSGWKEVRDAK